MARSGSSALKNPATQYSKPPFKEQSQPEPGLAKKMEPKPDHGEETYIGRGRLQGRKALITGADSGIGRATAIAFAREGADVAINYLPAEKADEKEVIAIIKAEGRKVVDLPGDISNESFCKKLVEQSVKGLDGLDILVNIAGKQVAKENIEDISTSQFDKTFKTNIYSMFWLCKYALPHLPAGASIINTASIQSYQPSPQLLDYASTKAAIVAFTKALAKQAISKGIRVNAVAPGPIWTPLQPSRGQLSQALPKFGEKTPMKRPGQPAEVAPAYVFFASMESSYVTAEVLGVTGGQHLP
jgi:NAD(P)-dependent dehydrogenase (short-subunit alcohol dehydrogenase family)